MRGWVLRLLTPVFGTMLTGAATIQTTSSSRGWNDEPPSAPPGNPLVGMLILAGVFLIILLIVWLVSRTDDPNPS